MSCRRNEVDVSEIKATTINIDPDPELLEPAMRLSYAAGALALSTTASAFSDTSPFALLSTAQFPDTLSHDQLQTSSQVEHAAKGLLSSCPTDRYLVVLQPNLSAEELRGATSHSAPNLQRALTHEGVATAWTVASVAGEVSLSEITRYINDGCAKADKAHQLEEVKLPALSSGDSASRLADNDYVLGESIRAAQAGESYTIVYLTTPAEAPRLKASPIHAELKRGVSPLPIQRRDESGRDTRSLFEKYQFFNSGLFMTILGSAILLSILGVGINALSSITVSYGAFSKEMGPGAQKKQQ
ncbi:uncharacterized protein DNG_03432 [Cephalotrichum gorgonifer]|uniref:Protein BIG1 n=1 Tax=Cephalotrichum gorgonifer TaxID=2041049 RepID=A0AAE8MU93_9PEZI|nr:uncharacterized protein DNG_03432 [Cephalotrichum gorgonifer]